MALSIHYWSRLWHDHADEAIAAGGKILVILAGYFILRFVILKLIVRLADSLLAKVSAELAQARQARVRALESVLRSAVTFVLGFVAAIMVLRAAGMDIVPLLTTASVAGLAIGFGAQKLVRDVIAGMFILIEDQYGVGDRVTIGAVNGTVEEFGMRTTRVRDRAGNLWSLSNGDIVSVCNHSRGKLLAWQDVAVPAATDLQKAYRVLDGLGSQISQEMPSMVLEPFACKGLAQVSGATATIRFQGVVAPQFQEEVQLALNDRIRTAFRDNELQLA
jgi:small-conductance mechanosensitive channel